MCQGILTQLHHWSRLRDFVIVQNLPTFELRSSFRFNTCSLAVVVVLDCVHKATDNQMVIPVGSGLSMQPMPPPWLHLWPGKKYDALFAFNWWGAIRICKCSIILKPYGTAKDTLEGLSKMLVETSELWMIIVFWGNNKDVWGPGYAPTCHNCCVCFFV